MALRCAAPLGGRDSSALVFGRRGVLRMTCLSGRAEPGGAHAESAVMPSGLAEFGVLADRQQWRWWAARHNQSASRNAKSWSLGRYRPGLAPRGAILAIASSFKRWSACW